MLALAAAIGFAGAAAAEKATTIVCFGDSLTAGYQLPPDAAFPVVLEKALRGRGLAVNVGNAGVSGDTSSGALARLDWSVPEGTDMVILEIGANDMLRGLPPAAARGNVKAMLARLKTRGIKVLLAGMYAAPNLGREYGAAFNAIYPELAGEFGAALYPFFLDGVTGAAGMTQPDGLHPTRAGVEEIVRRIAPQVEAMARGLAAK